MIIQRGVQAISIYCKLFLAVVFVFLAICLGLGFGSVITWLLFVYFCSYVKLAITLIKYMPQVSALTACSTVN